MDEPSDDSLPSSPASSSFSPPLEQHTGSPKYRRTNAAPSSFLSTLLLRPLARALEPIVSRISSFTSSPRTIRAVVRSVLWCILLVCICVLAVIIYAGLYRLYIPQVEHIRPIYFQYQRDRSGCATARTWLSDYPGKAALAPGQAYDIVIDIRAPISSPNTHVGNFMLILQLMDSQSNLHYHSARPTSLMYRSTVLHELSNIIFWLPLVLGFRTWGTERLVVPMLEGVVSPPSHDHVAHARSMVEWAESLQNGKPGEIIYDALRKPVESPNEDLADPIAQKAKEALAEIIRRHETDSKSTTKATLHLCPSVNTYEVSLRVYAHFTNLRYFMFYWFFTSALVGILGIIVLELVVLIIVWRFALFHRISMKATTLGAANEGDEDQASNTSLMADQEPPSSPVPTAWPTAATHTMGTLVTSSSGGLNAVPGGRLDEDW